LRGAPSHVKPILVQRVFTLAQANVLIPRLTSTLRRTSQLALQLSQLTRRNESGTEVQVQLLQELLAQETQAMEKLGVIARDLSAGLVDFPSVLDGEREVLLCWRVGEREVGHFHDPHASCESRRAAAGHHFFDRRQLGPPRD
jgi:hypothetical protein